MASSRIFFLFHEAQGLISVDHKCLVLGLAVEACHAEFNWVSPLAHLFYHGNFNFVFGLQVVNYRVVNYSEL